MKRLPRLTASCFVIIMGSLLSNGPDSHAWASHPNVILVMTDDQGYGDLGCHGNEKIVTPNLDRLYTQCTRLTDYHVTSLCTPTRAGLMTGRPAIATGAWTTCGGRDILRRDERTMADMFQGAGYATGMFGKWHLGCQYPYRPHDRGFQKAVYHNSGGVGSATDYWGNDYFDDTYFVNGEPTKFKGYCTDIWFDEAMKFVETKTRAAKPFFVYLATNAPHAPFLVEREYIDKYDADGHFVLNPAFSACITRIDENMGRLMKRLDALGIANDTILMFTTDNGTAGGHQPGPNPRGYNAGMRGKKTDSHDGGHRVPMFMRWPGKLQAGRDIDWLTSNLDMLPTLADLCGIDTPSDGLQLRGKSLRPLLTGNASEWTERVLISDRQPMKVKKWAYSAVLTERWRLVDGTELYDIVEDPGQTNDLADAHPEVFKRLRAEYESHWAEVSTRIDEVVPLFIGLPGGPKTITLTGLEWHAIPGRSGAQLKSPQRAGVAIGKIAYGFWAVDVARAGTYHLTLRRWPDEAGVADKPIRETFLNAVKARLQILDRDNDRSIYDETLPVAADTTQVTFEAKLPAGRTKMMAWFIDEQGKECGAYYVYATRIDKQP